MLPVKVMKEMKEEKSEYLEILNEDSLLGKCRPVVLNCRLFILTTKFGLHPF